MVWSFTFSFYYFVFILERRENKRIDEFKKCNKCYIVFGEMEKTTGKLFYKLFF